MKLPPCNIEAEESILSAILIDNSYLEDCSCSNLRPEHFYNKRSAKIFDAMMEMRDRNISIDLVTLSERLKEKNNLAVIGGCTKLAEIIDAVPMAANIDQYAKIIIELYNARTLIKNLHIAIEKLHSVPSEGLNFFQNISISDNTTTSTAQSISDLLPETITQLENESTGILSDFYYMDHILNGFQPGDLIIIAARPAMGKTGLALNIARNVSDKKPVLFVSIEMSKSQIMKRLLATEGRINIKDLDQESWNKLIAVSSVIDSLPLFINDNTSISTNEIKNEAIRLKKTHGLGLIVIDYIQLMLPTKSQSRRDLEIAEISRSLKSMAKTLDVPIIALSQLNRMLEQRSSKRPMLSDLRESGALEQDADIVMFIYRDEVYNKEPNNPHNGLAEINIAKHRNGPMGTFRLAFRREYVRFDNFME